MTREHLERQLEALFSDNDAFSSGPESAAREPQWGEPPSGRQQVRRLAEEPSVAEEGAVKPIRPDLDRRSGQRDMVTFRLGQQAYALPIKPIVQIIEMVTITPIPQLNGSVKGMINIWGQAVPVIDLRRHLGLPETLLGLRTLIVLLQVKE